MEPKIACIVVTYNRLALLKRCIEALNQQTYKNFNIIVVNNGSTDGTENWIKTQPKIIPYNQTNLGGAGGFHYGIKYAFNNNYDWFWVMDDDGVPESHCLENLLNASKLGFHYIAPILKDFNGHNHFDLILSNSHTNLVNCCGGPFNAILLSKFLIASIGLPNRLFFIWGDEDEFVNRVKEGGFHLCLVKDAIHYHKMTVTSNNINYKRLFFLVRNSFWIARLSKTIIGSKKYLYIKSIKLSIKYFTICFFRFKIKYLFQICKAIYAGIFYEKSKLELGSKL